MNAQTQPTALQQAQALLDRARVEAGNRRQDQAIELLIQADALLPNHSTLVNEIGVMHFQLRQFAEAERYFRRATEIKSDFPLAWTNLGSALNEMGDKEACIAYHEKSVEIDPGFAIGWRNLCKGLCDINQFERAVFCGQQAVKHERKDLHMSCYGLAIAFRRAGRFTEGRTWAEKAVQLVPGYADAHYELALAHFHLEDYAAGIQEYEWRMHKRAMIQHKQELWPIFSKPEFAGESLRDKTLLIHTEQGFGDNILFARFLPLVRPHVKRLVMWCRHGLEDLFNDNFAIDEYSDNVFKLPEFDCHLPLLSIAARFDPEMLSMRMDAPYIRQWPARNWNLPCKAGHLKIGLVWSASDHENVHTTRKVELNALAPLFALKQIDWVSLQVGDSEQKELAASPFASKITELGSQLRNFSETASAISQLDLVISCDTAVAHLAGAMGKPVMLMLRKNPDWRWHSDGERSVWYPTARLYRQTTFDDWSHVAHRIARDLANLPHKQAGEALDWGNWRR